MEQRTLLLLPVELSVVASVALPSHFLLCGFMCLRNVMGFVNTGEKRILMSVRETDYDGEKGLKMGRNMHILTA